MIEDTQRLNVILEARQWNNVMQVLANGPYNIVAPLIDAIRSQCMEHDKENVKRPNGGDSHWPPPPAH